MDLICPDKLESSMVKDRFYIELVGDRSTLELMSSHFNRGSRRIFSESGAYYLDADCLQDGKDP